MMVHAILANIFIHIQTIEILIKLGGNVSDTRVLNPKSINMIGVESVNPDKVADTSMTKADRVFLLRMRY